MMEIRVLGCSGSKVPGKLLTSFLVNGRILLDAGSAAQALSIEEQARITDIFITHPHLDHISDIGFIADNVLHLFIEEQRRPIRVHALEKAVYRIEKHLINNSIWPDFSKLPNPEAPVLQMAPMLPGKTFIAHGMAITPFEVDHAGGDATGYVIRHDGKVAAYTGDTGPEGWPEVLSEFGDQLTDLIVEVSFPSSMKALAVLTGHLTPELLKAAVDKLPVKPHLYITHIKSIGENRIRQELAELFPEGSIQILEQGDILNF